MENLGLWIFLGVLVVLFVIFILPGFAIIGARDVGIVTRKNFGRKLPEGHIIACDGEIGIQADVLRPGFYWRFPILWSIKSEKIIEVKPSQIGLIKSVDGKALPSNRLLGDEVDCDSFQDAKAFLKNGGFRGAQIGILRPGTYRINTSAFEANITKATEIKENQIGVIIAQDGKPLPTGYVIAPRPQGENGEVITDPRFVQDGQGFIRANGYRGSQLDTLQPGTYYINTLLFEVKIYPIAEVPPGYVAVIRSNVGLELDKSNIKPDESGGSKDLKGLIHEEVERLLIIDKNTRGIWREPVAPGKYNLNPIAYTQYLVPTSAVTIDWAGQEKGDTKVIGVRRDDDGTESEFFRFNPLRVTSKDGFQLDVSVKLIIRITQENAAFVIARFGSVGNLIEQIAHPLIDSSFRNNAGEKKAIEFVHSRTELQQEALKRAKDEFDKYNVEAQNLLIAYIDVDKSLLETQTKREIAVQQQEQYKEEANAQDKLIAVKEKTARAEKQQEVIAAKLSIDINADKATAMINEAGGKKSAMILEAEGQKQKNQLEGEGIAVAYEKQAEAMNKNSNYVMLKIFETLAQHNIKLVPDTLISSGNDSSNGNILNWFLSTMTKKGN